MSDIDVNRIVSLKLPYMSWVGIVALLKDRGFLHYYTQINRQLRIMNNDYSTYAREWKVTGTLRMWDLMISTFGATGDSRFITAGRTLHEAYLTALDGLREREGQ